MKRTYGKCCVPLTLTVYDTLVKLSPEVTQNILMRLFCRENDYDQIGTTFRITGAKPVLGRNCMTQNELSPCDSNTYKIPDVYNESYKTYRPKLRQICETGQRLCIGELL